MTTNQEAWNSISAVTGQTPVEDWDAPRFDPTRPAKTVTIGAHTFAATSVKDFALREVAEAAQIIADAYGDGFHKATTEGNYSDSMLDLLSVAIDVARKNGASRDEIRLAMKQA